MGEIFLAEDTKLERRIVLKFLPRHLTEDREARTRFEREAKAAAALNHPNIVTIHEIGEHEGQVFIAMEYVEGQTLKEMISGSVGANNHSPLPTHHPIPITQVVDIALQIASGLAAAHEKGIVHRDVKPQNIVIDRSGQVKILDFGLAKLKGASPLTQESFAMGTVHYMSPEQGLGREVDARSDVWSLGVVLYEMLAGALPFRGDYDQAVIYSILHEELPALPDAARRKCPGLEGAVRRCLAKKREDRFQAAELAAVLNTMAGGKSATRPERGASHGLRRRALPAGAALLLLGGFLGFLALNPSAKAALRRALGLSVVPQERHIAVLPLLGDPDAESRDLADGLTAVIVDKLTWLEKYHDALWTVPARRTLQDRGSAPAQRQRLLGCNLFVGGEFRTERNSLRLRLELTDARTGRPLRQVERNGDRANLTLFQDGLLPLLQQLVGLPQSEAAEAHANMGGTSMPGAYILYLKGRGLAREGSPPADIDRGIVFLEKALQQDGQYALARLALLDGWRCKAELGKDPGWRERAGSQWSRIRETAESWAPAQLAWGKLLRENGAKEEARQAFRSALNLDGRSYEACVQLAKCSAEAGNTTEAEGLFKKAIRLRSDYPQAHEELAYFYQSHGRLDEALLLYKKISELTPGDPQIFNNLGAMHLLRGEKRQARAMLERSNAIQPNAVVQSNLAVLYYYDGEYRKALALHLQAVQNSTEHYEWGNLADTCRHIAGQEERAAAAYRRAIDLAEKRLASTPDDADLLSCLALYYAHAGQKQKAVAAVAAARALAPTFLQGIRRAVLVYDAVLERGLALAALREYAERLGELQYIEREPDLADLRRDPEYARIMREQKLR